MIWTPPTRRPRPSAEEIAAAMRDGLEARRFFRKLPPPVPERMPIPSQGEHLPGFLPGEGPALGPPPARLTDLPLPAGGRAGRAFKLARRAARKLLRPWLDHQSNVNAHQADVNAHLAEVARRAHRFDREILLWLADLKDYASRLNDRLADLQRDVSTDVIGGYVTSNARLNECFYDLYQLRQAVGAAGGSGDAPTAPAAGGLHVIEGLFLHTRLPTPPGRVLVVGTPPVHALDLASLGFQVVTAAGPPTARHPELWGPGAADPDDHGGAYDLAVALTGEGVGGGAADLWTDAGRGARADLARAVAPGGLVFGSARAGDYAPSWAGVAEAAAPFRPVEVCYAARAGDGWALHPDPAEGCEAVLWVAVNQ